MNVNNKNKRNTKLSKTVIFHEAGASEFLKAEPVEVAFLGAKEVRIRI